MTRHAPPLELRRHALIAQCEAQRIDLILRSQELRTVSNVIDHTVHAVQSVKQHPALLLGTLGALLLVLRPRRIAPMMGGLATAARTWKMIAPVVQRLRLLH